MTKGLSSVTHQDFSMGFSPKTGLNAGFFVYIWTQTKSSFMTGFLSMFWTWFNHIITFLSAIGHKTELGSIWKGRNVPHNTNDLHSPPMQYQQCRIYNGKWRTRNLMRIIIWEAVKQQLVNYKSSCRHSLKLNITKKSEIWQEN